MVIILRGTSGSGKSRLANMLMVTDFGENYQRSVTSPALAYAKVLWEKFIQTEHKLYKISADDYFMVKDEYKFDVKHLGAAHAACLRNFYKVVCDPKAIIIVDNTHCTLAEFVPYAALANAFAHELQILTLITDTVTAWKRNRHDVPFANVVKQAYNLQDSIANWPAWFPQQIFPE